MVSDGGGGRGKGNGGMEKGDEYDSNKESWTPKADAQLVLTRREEEGWN